MGKKIIWLLCLPILLIVPEVSAHEAYVLTPLQFHAGLMVNTTHPLAGLLDPTHYKISALITVLVVLSYVLALLFAVTRLAAISDKLIKKLKVVGPILIRLAMSASFIIGSLSGVIFGPELPLSNIPGGHLIQFGLLAAGIMVLLGFLTEVAALMALTSFLYLTHFFGSYLVTYANYLGEIIVLLLFGSRFFSLDLIFFGKKTHFSKLEKYRFLETPIVRMLYGIALIYAGYSIKFAHQGLSVLVYNEYHLRNFFHAQASFIAAGAGVSEILIGFFILIGFAQRFTVLISLVFITLSLLYFREMVWPHFMLYGISLNLIINSADQFSVDRYFVPWIRAHILKKELVA